MNKMPRPIRKLGAPGRRPGRFSPGAKRSQSAVPPPPPPRAAGPVGQRPPWYKRKYLVYPRFQMTLILMNSAVTIVLFGLTAFLVVRSHIYLEALVRQTRMPAQNLFTQLLTQQLRSLLLYMVIALVVGVLTTGLTTLLLSHKMAGPMIRLRNFFNGIEKDGEFPKDITFRSGDFFQDLPPSINRAFEALKRKWSR